MKKIGFFLALVVLVVPRVCSEEMQPPHITVYGTATTEVKPDQMIWQLTVRYVGADPEAAAQEQAKAVSAVLKLLKDNRIDEKDIQTSDMQFGENWEYRASSRVKEGYFAATDVSFKSKDFGAYQTLWFGLSRIPAVGVRGVGYDHTQRIAYQNETRQKALLAAKEKAQAMAGALGATLGEVLLIEEDLAAIEGWRNRYLVQNVAAVDAGGGEGDEALAPGMIPIRIRVKVSFQLISRK